MECRMTGFNMSMASMDPERPNIVFILSDDQGAWATGYSGNDEISTPNLDGLAASGMRFENFFCSSPVCSPARATLLTGRIPSQHGIHDWISRGNHRETNGTQETGELIEYLKGQAGYTDILAAAGYRCGISGKWHLGDSHHPQKGLTYWQVHATGAGKYYNAPMIRDGEIYRETNYVTDVITDNGIAFLEQQVSDPRPFCLNLHYTAPHAPWQREHHPKALFDKYHRECPFESVPEGLAPPEWTRHLSIPVKDAGQRREYLSGYYAAVEAMDSNIGRVLHWLDTHGLRDNTLVFFTSDNGMNMGHHGVFGKGNATFPLNMFEESVKVPFIASRPGHIPAGQCDRGLYSQYDFLPTLLASVGIKCPDREHLPGMSFAGALRGESRETAEAVVVFDEYGPVRMIRTTRWKYVHRTPYGHHELFDLENDPGESDNLAGDDGYNSVRKEMRARLTEWFARYTDPLRDGTKEAVTGSGQVNLCGPGALGAESFSKGRITHLLSS